MCWIGRRYLVNLFLMLLKINLLSEMALCLLFHAHYVLFKIITLFQSFYWFPCKKVIDENTEQFCNFSHFYSFLLYFFSEKLTSLILVLSSIHFPSISLLLSSILRTLFILPSTGYISG